MSILAETGRYDGQKSLLNKLYKILDRTSAHLFSPVELKFSLDFEKPVPAHFLDKAKVVAGHLTRNWELADTDTTFARGVFDSLKYGVAILKQWPEVSGTLKDEKVSYERKLVMPWQFGVYRDDINDIDSQPAMCESVLLTMPEVWRRIWHLPDAQKLYDRIKTNAAPGSGQDVANNFFHQVLSTSPIQTGVSGAQRPVPGGIVQVSNDSNFSTVPPTTTAPMVKMHELWVWGQDDYTTIQIIEPDILVAPLLKHSNLLIGGDAHSGLHPYTLIQPNQTHGNLWGRSEISDLMAPQDFLSTTAQDIKRLFGVQVDKILFFSGDGMTDETYDQMRAAGYGNLGPGGDVKDMTPKFPPEALQLIDKLIQMLEMISGFDNILSGRGETGVRSGLQTSTLVKTAGAPHEGPQPHRRAPVRGRGRSAVLADAGQGWPDLLDRPEADRLDHLPAGGHSRGRSDVGGRPQHLTDLWRREEQPDHGRSEGRTGRSSECDRGTAVRQQGHVAGKVPGEAGERGCDDGAASHDQPRGMGEAHREAGVAAPALVDLSL